MLDLPEVDPSKTPVSRRREFSSHRRSRPEIVDITEVGGDVEMGNA